MYIPYHTYRAGKTSTLHTYALMYVYVYVYVYGYGYGIYIQSVSLVKSHNTVEVYVVTRLRHTHMHSTLCMYVVCRVLYICTYLSTISTHKHKYMLLLSSTYTE